VDVSVQVSVLNSVAPVLTFLRRSALLSTCPRGLTKVKSSAQSFSSAATSCFRSPSQCCSTSPATTRGTSAEALLLPPADDASAPRSPVD
jgi:hypothetical protein